MPTFTRTGTALQRDFGGGSYTSVGANTQRDQHYVLVNGVWRPMLRLDFTTTNFLLNSGTPNTQTVSLAAGNYCLWMEGAGSVTLSGGPVGTASAGNPVTFTLGGTTSVTFTTAGIDATSRFQCEIGFNPTSYVATAGTAVTRNSERWNTTIPSTGIVSMTCYASIYELHNHGFGNMGLIHVGLSTVAGPFWRVESGTINDQLRVRFYDGTTNFNSPNSGVGIGFGDHLEVLTWIDTAAQRCKLQTIRNGIQDAVVQTGIIAFPANFAGTSLHLGSNDEGGGMGMSAESAYMASGVQTLDTMRALAGGGFAAGALGDSGGIVDILGVTGISDIT